ncbi:MAG: hypothetical protein A2Y10_02415 [Planctomycetes bacterium GWF2_41_51]|nr:MAG: hypothetical protein A2Y10_02415 [Planctomycetes bacterium GWF2_41_51]
MGNIAQESAQKIVDCQLVAVADVRKELAEAAARKFNLKKFYTNAEDLINDEDVDAVILSLPACLRTKLALQAFAKSKHVLIEKPVAMNTSEVEKMIAAQGNLISGCCSSRFRFYESADVAEKFIAEDKLGKIKLIRCRAVLPLGKVPETTPPSWRLKKAINGGGIMMNWGCYDLDYLLGILRWSIKPELVFAQTWQLPVEFSSYAAPDSDAETHCVATIMCENNVAIHYERGEMVCAQAESAWDIIGDLGAVHLKMIEGNKKMIYVNGTSGKGAAPEVLWQGKETWDNMHLNPINDFVAAICWNRQPKTNLKQSLIIQKVTDAIYASAEQCKAVEIH